jgi:hypothetical protein
LIDNKKSLEHDHKKIYDIIFDINPQIRYIGFYHNGYFEGQMREGKKAYLTNEESQKSLEMAVKRWENRKEFSKKIGGPLYTLTMYQLVKRVIMELSTGTLILISTELEVDHEIMLLNLMDKKKDIMEMLKQIPKELIPGIKKDKEPLEAEIKELQQERLIFKELYKQLSTQQKELYKQLSTQQKESKK